MVSPKENLDLWWSKIWYLPAEKSCQSSFEKCKGLVKQPTLLWRSLSLLWSPSCKRISSLRFQFGRIYEGTPLALGIYSWSHLFTSLEISVHFCCKLSPSTSPLSVKFRSRLSIFWIAFDGGQYFCAFLFRPHQACVRQTFESETSWSGILFWSNSVSFKLYLALCRRTLLDPRISVSLCQKKSGRIQL